METLKEQDFEALDETREAKELIHMKTATSQIMQKLRKFGLVYYIKSGINKGWNMTNKGYNIWKQYYIEED